jgi:hypothetical protein
MAKEIVNLKIICRNYPIWKTENERLKKIEQSLSDMRDNVWDPKGKREREKNNTHEKDCT